VYAWLMTFSEVPSPPKAQTQGHEEVKVGDAVKINVKESDKPIECAVVGRRGRAVKLMYEDGVTTSWVDTTSLVSVMKDGAEELMSRAARAAAAAAEAAAKKKAEDEAKAAEKAREEARIAAEKAEEKRLYDTYMNRAKKTVDWMPSGLYFNTDHLPIPDHQKDVFRVIWYEIDVTRNYKKDKPKYEPDNKHCGDRIFYTDGTVFNCAYVVGSDDKTIKGDGPAKSLLGEDAFQGWITKTIQFKEAFDGGKTLLKHDSYPPEDPAVWADKDTDTFSGPVRTDEEGNWHW